MSLLSSNTHDRTIETVMTGAFVLGALCAFVGFVVGAIRAAPAMDGK